MIIPVAQLPARLTPTWDPNGANAHHHVFLSVLDSHSLWFSPPCCSRHILASLHSKTHTSSLSSLPAEFSGRCGARIILTPTAINHVHFFRVPFFKLLLSLGLSTSLPYTMHSTQFAVFSLCRFPSQELQICYLNVPLEPHLLPQTTCQVGLHRWPTHFIGCDVFGMFTEISRWVPGNSNTPLAYAELHRLHPR